MGEGNGRLKNILMIIVITLTIVSSLTCYIYASDIGSRKRDDKMDDRVDIVESNYARIENDLSWIKDGMLEQKELFKEILARVG